MSKRHVIGLKWDSNSKEEEEKEKKTASRPNNLTSYKAFAPHIAARATEGVSLTRKKVGC